MMNKAKVLALSMIIAIMTMYMPACAQEAEAADFTGVLTTAGDQKIIVSNAKETKEFVTDDSTTYDMGSENSFCMNDIVTVRYHSKGKKLVAEDMTLKKHTPKKYLFKGTVTGLTDGSVTVTGSGLTIMFARDGSTIIKGDLSKGDTVKIIYIGDLSESPQALRIVVTEEAKEEPKTLTSSGIISEFTDTSLLLSIDSAHSRKFTLDKNTQITGVANKLKVGDSVNVTFNNTEDAAPLAVVVNIVKEAAPDVRTINGTVKSIGSNAISLKTDQKTYTFTTNKNTKYKGSKPSVGCKAEITYVVDSGKNIATVVYCRKAPEKGIIAKGTVVSWGNGLTTISIDGKGNIDLKYTNKLEKAADYTPQAADYVQITYMKSTGQLSKIELIKRPDPPKPTPEEPVIAQGVLASWDTGKCTVTVNGADLNLTYNSDLDIAETYKPQAKDEVRIAYTQSDSVLRKIELVNRPQPEPVTAEGTLKAWGIDGQNRCSVLTADGTLELIYTPESLDMPIGYFPKAGDSVKITYTPDDMVLRSMIKLKKPDYNVEAEGTLKEWNNDGQNKCTVDITGSGEETFRYDPDKLIKDKDYTPQAEDYVKITYTSNDYVLTKIELKSRPDTKDDPAPADDQKPADDPAPADDQKPADDPAPADDQKPADEPAPADDQKPADEPAPADDQKDDSGQKSAAISGSNVTLESVDESGKKLTVRLENGETINLSITGDTSVPAGYFPQAGDTVDIVYDMDSMTLNEISLKGRAE